ncbi:MAG: UpxY family transcription antiterminator [Leptospira sp.]|nr:UpxY family transcription antiterminator [Leptospira sp.]
MTEITDNLERKWHIIYTNPRTEKRVLEYLKKYHFEAYLPIIRIKSRWKDRWKEIEKPLFTSYVFVKMSYWDEKKKILVLPGIHHIVFYKGQPAEVSDENLEMVELFATSFGEKLKVEKYEKLKPGNIVEIRTGILAGRKAEIIQMKNKTYVIVALPMMGQAVRAEVKIEDLGLEELRIE